jgi:hypothetical protein
MRTVWTRSRRRCAPATTWLPGSPACTLADAQVMGFERRTSYQTAQRITLQSTFSPRVAGRLGAWLPSSTAQTLQRWLPKSDVVRDIAFHPYNGIAGYTHGYGVSTRKVFDLAGRMTAFHAAGQRNVTAQRLDYGIGPRIRALGEHAAAPPAESRFDYTGFGASRPEPVAAPIRTACTGVGVGAAAKVVERDTQGRASGDGTLRYSYTHGGQLETIKSSDGKVVATYHYDARGQRVSKTLASSESLTSSGRTASWSLRSKGLASTEARSRRNTCTLLSRFRYEAISGVSTPADTTRTERGVPSANSGIGDSFSDCGLAKVAMRWDVASLHQALRHPEVVHFQSQPAHDGWHLRHRRCGRLHRLAQQERILSRRSTPNYGPLSP